MIKSMTGFGRAIAENEEYSLTVELKAVNHRFCEIYVRLPKQLNMLEDSLKKQIARRLLRGKIDVFITFEQIGERKIALKVDKALAISYYKAVQEIAEACHIAADVTLDTLAGFSGIFSLESEDADQEQIAALLAGAIEDALDGIVEMRITEGLALANDMLSHLTIINQNLTKIADFSAIVVEEQKLRLEQRLSVLLGDVELDQARLANELAFFADKVDINEELTRLQSHIEQFKSNLDKPEPVGRKLDFILQEMLRESNTIGSKSNNLEINNLVIDIKNELERIKEQVQNVE